MSTDHLADVRRIRQLVGADDNLEGMHAAARRLESIICEWRTLFPPRPRSVQDAENTLEGLRRSLMELKRARGLEATREGSHDAA